MMIDAPQTGENVQTQPYESLPGLVGFTAPPTALVRGVRSP
jgi:hypothetical protein